jgi:hypothetical protein
LVYWDSVEPILPSETCPPSYTISTAQSTYLKAPPHGTAPTNPLKPTVAAAGQSSPGIIPTLQTPFTALSILTVTPSL